MIRNRIARFSYVVLPLVGSLTSRTRALASEIRTLTLKELIAQDEKSIEELFRNIKATDTLPKTNAFQQSVKQIETAEIAKKEAAVIYYDKKTYLPSKRFKIIKELSLSNVKDEQLVFESLTQKNPLKNSDQEYFAVDQNNSQQKSINSHLVKVVIPDGPIEEHGIDARLVSSEVNLETKNKALESKKYSVLNEEKTDPNEFSEMGKTNFDVVVQISEESGDLKIVPSSLVFKGIGEKISISAAGVGHNKTQIFSRHDQVIAWDAKTHQVTATSAGQTELYIVYGKKMHILPIKVEPTSGLPNLDIPQDILSFNNPLLSDKNLQMASHGEHVETSDRYQDTGDSKIISLNASRAEAVKTLENERQEESKYKIGAHQVKYGQITIQAIDDRSVPAQGVIYPASNVEVHLLGTSFFAKTDETGHINIGEVPLDSRFLLALRDREGKFFPSTAEISTGSEPKAVIRVRVLRSFVFDSYRAISGSDLSTNLGSLCGTLSDHNSKERLSDLAVGIDVPARGPYYFNGYGILDPNQAKTGFDGRFCFFNISPGPLSIAVFDDGNSIGSFTTSAFAGQHSEIDLSIGANNFIETRLTMLPTAHQQLSSDIRAANFIKTVDMIDLIPLGSDEPMEQIAPGIVRTVEPILSSNQRVWAYAQAAEFEPVIYAHISNKRNDMTPLLPRGFIEDMSYYAQVVHDPSLGAVVVDYGGKNDHAGGSVSFKLVDSSGQLVGEPWYYSDRPTTKAIFFNVPPGTYGILIETGDSFWLASDTLVVFSETATSVRLGSKVEVTPN